MSASVGVPVAGSYRGSKNAMAITKRNTVATTAATAPAMILALSRLV